jgi:hypothetical protein
VRVAELTAFQRSKVLDIDDDMYRISQDMVHAATLISLSLLSSLSTILKRIIIAKCLMPQLIEKESYGCLEALSGLGF